MPKPFRFYPAQGFLQHVLYKAYNVEELKSRKLFQCIPIFVTLSDANVTSPHMPFKIKQGSIDVL